MEKILCAAIWYKELPLQHIFDANVLPVNCDKGIVFCGHRHPHCMYSMLSVTGLKSNYLAGESIQGFLTNKNRFVDRKEGLQIATIADQIIHSDIITQLHSEDLY